MPTISMKTSYSIDSLAPNNSVVRLFLGNSFQPPSGQRRAGDGHASAPAAKGACHPKTAGRQSHRRQRAAALPRNGTMPARGKRSKNAPHRAQAASLFTPTQQRRTNNEHNLFRAASLSSETAGASASKLPLQARSPRAPSGQRAAQKKRSERGNGARSQIQDRVTCRGDPRNERATVPWPGAPAAKNRRRLCAMLRPAPVSSEPARWAPVTPRDHSSSPWRCGRSRTSRQSIFLFCLSSFVARRSRPERKERQSRDYKPRGAFKRSIN